MNTNKLLADLRERMSKYTHNAIALKARLVRQTVSAIARGIEDNPRVGTLQKISDALDELEIES